jgi:hypothetical protein
LEKYRQRVFNKTVLRGVFGPKRDEIIGGWRNLHSEELHDCFSLKSVIRMMRPRMMRWAGHKAYMGEQCIQSFSRKI